MATVMSGKSSNDTSVAPRWWQRWPEWAGYAAVVWSLAYGGLILGLYLGLGPAGFPFGESDPQAVLSILGGLSAATGAPLIAALSLAGAVVAWVMARGWGRGGVRGLLITVAWIVAASLALLIPDYRGLMGVAYSFVFLVGLPFGWPPGNFFDVVTWPVANQFVCIIGGFAWAAAALAYQHRIGQPGLGGELAAWQTPAAAARWGTWATAIAVIIPLLYAATRWAWALGLPLGISEELFQEGEATGLWLAGAGLGAVAAGGAVLTLGLVQRWGEVFPRWLPGLAGKRVPPALAIVPAALVAVLVFTAGMMFVRLTLAGTLGNVFTFIGGDDWAALAPELLWPIWGIALGAATFAYAYRRRGEAPGGNAREGSATGG